ncbi:MAG: hypothetical protein HGA80_04485 [Candidatus Omnitrophica bacterium]|nr:hypothetical protein [Candidatus Omnitrophota bacterium]
MQTSPKVLVVYKRSSLEVAGKSLPSLSKVKDFIANHSRHKETLYVIEHNLNELGLKYKKISRNKKIDYSIYNIIITVGGDGTLLEAARNTGSNQLLLGVNSDPNWSIGKFCHSNADNFKKIMSRIINKTANINKLHKLKVVIQDHKSSTKTIECLNDILVCHANPAAMGRYKIFINRQAEEHRNSGIWISSAAGSTGAILSAGGIRVPKESRSIQYRPRELYNLKGNLYKLTGGLISPGKVIKLQSMMSQGRIFVDGAHVHYAFPYGCRAIVSSSSNYINLVTR